MMIIPLKVISSKNVRLQMGRCPVRGIFTEALAVLEKKQNELRQVHPLTNTYLFEG
jgi:hypothetical protein